MESPLSGPSKRTRGLSNGTQVPCCLVDGCRADLSKCRDYHRRHKVCEPHSKTPKVTISGHEQRFCQQCSRFHSLEEFDDEKRSCRKRLDGHNRRRRKPQPDAFISINSARFLSTYQGTRFSPFHNSQTYLSSMAIGSPLSMSTNREAAYQSHPSIGISAPRKSGHNFPRGSDLTAQIHHSSHHHHHHQYLSPEKEMMSFYQGPPNRSATTTTTVPPLLWLHREDENNNDNENNNNNCALSLLSTTPTGSGSSNSGAHTGNHHHHLVQGGGPDYYYHDHHRSSGLGNVGEQPQVSGSGSGSGLVIHADGRENAANNYFHCQDMFRAWPDRSFTGPQFHGSSQYGGGSRIPP